MEAIPIVQLRPMQLTDLDQLAAWFDRPHIRPIFGTMEETDEWLEEIQENLPLKTWVQHFMVEIEPNQAIGFAQYYETDQAPAGIWSQEPPGTVGIDYLIGEQKFIGKGIGRQMLQALLEEILQQDKYHAVIADPDLSNLASIRLLESAGFTRQANDLYRLKLS